MTNSVMAAGTIASLFGDASLTEAERAIAEMRAGRPVILAQAGRLFLVASAEFADAERLSALNELAGGALQLVLTPARLRALGRPEYTQPMAIPASALGSERVQALIAQELSARDMNGQAKAELREELVEPGPAGAAALQLATLALMLPAVLMGPLAPAALTLPALTVRAEAIAGFGEDRATHVEIVSRAPVPLISARDCEFVVFRGGEGMREQVAVIVGAPDPARPVLVRLHSACLTGDLFGSLRCDCGDQLRATVASMAQAGGGVLLYLDQEGRGNGIANKMRAYRLQSDGLDTYEADETLGFDLDGRRFDFAAAMLRQLGYDRVILMTNNPEKIGALRRAGLDVTGVERLYGRRGADNIRYLAAKRDRAGHFLDLDALDHHAPTSCG
ncbi:GTP cyclohydrolase II [Ancylobacter aquaticus]|uniref:GTP cyclohydrolase-2 n=1 Tax=Ancylobacter aquaticus TaxID=100 RepID=A0A4R1I101_ANCAQ|nr:GTP cyclohydrolase II RibA [Ancylobacter aquaticus]TCK23592.1 GTP cyclohydrolase II [Ancylobacter aquaticus]